MASDEEYTDIQASMPRKRNQRLGMNLEKKESTLKIHKIDEELVEAMEDRQLMKGDVILSVNDKSDIEEMLNEFKNDNLDKCNLSVRRYVTVGMTCNICLGTIEKGHLKSERHVGYVEFFKKTNALPQYMPYSQRDVSQPPLQKPQPPPQPPPPAGPPPTRLVGARNSNGTMPDAWDPWDPILPSADASPQQDTRCLDPWESKQPRPVPDPWDSKLPSADHSAQQDTRNLGSNAALTSSSPILSVTNTKSSRAPVQTTYWKPQIPDENPQQPMKTNDLPQYMPYSQGDVSQPTLQQPPPPPQPPPPAGPPPSRVVGARNSNGTMPDPWESKQPTPVPDPWDSILPSANPSPQQETRTVDQWESKQPTPVPDPWDSKLPSADPSAQQDTRTLGSNAALTSSSSVLSVTSTKSCRAPVQTTPWQPQIPDEHPQQPKQQDEVPGIGEKEGEYTVGNAPSTATFQLQHMPEKTAASTFSAIDTKSCGTTVQTSSTAQESQYEPQYSHAITIATYNPDRVEKLRGYLKLDQGTVVTILSGSRQPSALGNAFTCDYVFAWLANHEGKHNTRGWVPIDVLGNIPTCQDIAQE